MENSRKVFEGREEGLQSKTLMDKKRKEEEDFKAKVAANPEWKKDYGDAWDLDARAIEKEKSRVNQLFFRPSTPNSRNSPSTSLPTSPK